MSVGIKKLGVLVCNKGCNADCSFCAGKQHRTQENFDFQLFKSIVENNKKTIEELSISGGGEPLLQPNYIYKTLHTISEYQIKKIKLYTNGILLKDSVQSLKDWKNMGLTHLYITVHNPDPNKSRTTLRTTHLPPSLSDIKEIESETGLIVRINIPLFKDGISTQSELDDMIERLKSNGLTNYSYWVIRDNNDKRDKELSPVFEFVEPIYDETKQTLFPNGELRFDWCN